jgi:hypothetical protein
MVHTCNPSYLRDEIERSVAQGQPRQEGRKNSISINKSGMVVNAYNPSYVEDLSKRIAI